ncbi:MAG: nucleoside-triphosphatase [Anaerolineae bacterium]
MTRVVVLTGERGVGKTHLCQAVVEQAGKIGFRCAGVLSRAVFDGEEKAAITLVDVATSAERTLAVADDTPGELRWGRYRFVPSTLAWGSDLLTGATPCDLLIVDELGPLELTLGLGLEAALDVLDEGAFSLALVVVRPELLDTLRKQLNCAETRVVEVDLQNRDQLPGQILSLLDERPENRDLPFGADHCTMDE